MPAGLGGAADAQTSASALVADTNALTACGQG